MSLPKTIALLELSGNGYLSNDKTVKATLEFYWKNYPKNFLPFPILDTQSILDKTIELLDIYYKSGYRYFFGFSRSTIVSGVLEWFNLHPEAVGFSTTSTAPILDIPKKIYRMTPNDNYSLDSVLSNLEVSTTVYYIYTKDEVAMLNIKAILESNLIIAPKLISFAVNPDSSNLTKSNIQNLFVNPSDSQSILTYLLDREPYINLYNEGLTFPGQQYDILGIQPPTITGTALIELNSKYNITSYKGTNTSVIWRNGYNMLGQDNYSIVTLNVLNMLNMILSGEEISNLNSHFGILQFDPISRDILYPTFLIETLVDSIFKSNKLVVNEPILGKYEATFIN